MIKNILNIIAAIIIYPLELILFGFNPFGRSLKELMMYFDTDLYMMFNKNFKN